MAKLIILRGPAAAGKSTVAKSLMKRTKRPTLLVELDYYRFAFVNPPEYSHNLEYEMSGSAISVGLGLGFDVIFEGNFSASRSQFLEKVLSAHPEENYVFYLDASLTETLKRHETRDDQRLSSDKLEELYPHASPMGYEKEITIPGDSSLEQTVEQICQVAGL